MFRLQEKIIKFKLTFPSSKKSTGSAETPKWSTGKLWQSGTARKKGRTEAAQIKFLQPPAFAGKENEDVGDWIYKFERIGRYNRWGDDELRGHVELSLTGAAQKWFTCAEAAGQLSAD